MRTEEKEEQTNEEPEKREGKVWDQGEEERGEEGKGGGLQQRRWQRGEGSREGLGLPGVLVSNALTECV